MRVNEILAYTSVHQYNLVATCNNPANDGTRNVFAEVLHSSSWVWGPDFLN